MLLGHSLGSDQEMKAHATRQGTLVYSRLSSLGNHGLSLTQKVELVRAS